MDSYFTDFLIFKFLSFRGGKDSILSIKIWEKAKILKYLHCKIVLISGFYRLKSAEVNVFGYLVIYRCTSCRIMLLPGYICFQIVCQACSSNKHGLDYMKNQPARVCDHCFRELQKQGKKTTNCLTFVAFITWYVCTLSLLLGSST